jgi:hypothetical protein
MYEIFYFNFLVGTVLTFSCLCHNLFIFFENFWIQKQVAAIATFGVTNLATHSFAG